MITPEALAAKLTDVMAAEDADAMTMIRAMSIISSVFGDAIALHFTKQLEAEKQDDGE